ncbi:hypothetical protein B0A48_07704 [Cryoendolithus antarcticus]|uniref:Glycolipid transfer protein domain-containing protein n=1 Tax=Cryoendolithus antarcticus TaxID=1507870 RepID=A0A1V8T6V4_9PEZI|nr:hypothetical protein B0A48_07704 [Cryoendolithus antarcticus]
MAAAYPPGGTFFDNRKSFATIPLEPSSDPQIPTGPFLEAAEALTALFDVLGSAAFKPVKSDMNGNIKKIRDRQLASPLESETLQGLVKTELREKKSHTATEGLVWLVRGLDFTAQALRHNTSNPSSELAASFRESYTHTLKPHHSMFVKPIFSAAMSATPYRKDFYAKLGDDQTRVAKELDDWLTALEKNVKVLNTFLAKPEAKW